MNNKEREMLFRLQLRNEKGLLYFFDEYYSIVWLEITKQLYLLPDLQEECLFQVFYQVWENIDCFNEESQEFHNWLLAITRYNCINYLKKYSKQKEQINHQELQKEIEDMLSIFSFEEKAYFWNSSKRTYELLNYIQIDVYDTIIENNNLMDLKLLKKRLLKKISKQKTVVDVFTKIFGGVLTTYGSGMLIS